MKRALVLKSIFLHFFCFFIKFCLTAAKHSGLDHLSTKSWHSFLKIQFHVKKSVKNIWNEVFIHVHCKKNNAACRLKECENATVNVRTLIRTFKLSTEVRLPKRPACFKTQAFVEKASRCRFFL